MKEDRLGKRGRRAGKAPSEAVAILLAALPYFNVRKDQPGADRCILEEMIPPFCHLQNISPENTGPLRTLVFEAIAREWEMRSLWEDWDYTRRFLTGMIRQDWNEVNALLPWAYHALSPFCLMVNAGSPPNYSIAAHAPAIIGRETFRAHYFPILHGKLVKAILDAFQEGGDGRRHLGLCRNCGVILQKTRTRQDICPDGCPSGR